MGGVGLRRFVVIFDQGRSPDLFRRLRSDILVKGGTYSIEEVVGKEAVEGCPKCACLAELTGI